MSIRGEGRARMRNGLIVAPQPEAVEAGAEILMRGGNAIDAAIACALVQGVVDPQMAGIAGFGSLHVHMPREGVHRCLDFHARVPAVATPEMWEELVEAETRDGFGFRLTGNVNDIGYQSIAVPGSLLAYQEALETLGTMPWGEIVAPAVEAAEAGFIVRPDVYLVWTDPTQERMGRIPLVDRLAFSRSGRSIYFRSDGALKQPGDHVSNPDLALTLRRIMEGGAEVFYEGEIAQQIDRDMRANGGLLRARDLASYRVVTTEPLWGTYRGFDVATNHPPGGGVVLLEMLHILENFDLRSLGHNTPEYIRVVSEAMKQATVDKDAHVGDPAFVEVPVSMLLDEERARSVADGIEHGRIIEVDRYERPAERPQTTHVSVVDSQGNAVSLTHSIGMPSGVITDGLGFMYNGCMAVFDPRPGRTGSIEPGKSRFSSMCPTILFKAGEPVLVTGAPGGTRIAMEVLQTILNQIDFGMSVAEAVDAPRFSATSNNIDICNRIPRYTARSLERRGYGTIRSHLSHGFALVHAIALADGGWEGAADPGAGGMALAV